MVKCRPRLWLRWIIPFFLLALIWGSVVWGEEEKPAATPPAEVEQEAPPEKPREEPKPPEKKPAKPSEAVEKLPETRAAEPGYYPGSPVPSSFQDVGPITGALSPYGNPMAYDTLQRGWQLHRLKMLGVSPFLGYDMLYRTNIFQTHSDKKADLINTLTPGLLVELPIAQRHKVTLSYLGNYFIFSRFGENSHFDHNFHFDATANFRSGLSVLVGNTYRIATEERTAQAARQRQYDRETPYLEAIYKFADKWRLRASYQFDVLTFNATKADQVDDYQQHTAGLTAYYKFWPKTAALLEHVFTVRTYPFFPAGNNTSQTPMVGLTTDPTAKISGLVKLGYSFKSYDHSVIGRDNSPQSPILTLQAGYRYSNYTNITLVGQRSIVEDLDFNNNAFTNTAVFFTLNHEFSRLKLMSYLSFSYSNDDYLNPALDSATGTFKFRHDNIVTIGCGVNRKFTRWVMARLGYQYINKASNFSTFAYNEHRLFLGLQTSF